jgi:hypothetical protein
MSYRWPALATATLFGLAACADAPTTPARSAPRLAAAAAEPSGAPSAAPSADVLAQTPWADRFAYALQPYSNAFPWGQTWTSTPGYAYSSSGGAITFTRLAPGSYNVNFEGLGRPGLLVNDQYGSTQEVVLATAAFTGLPSVTCNAISWMNWLSVTRLTARVDCMDATGQGVDTPFSVVVVGDRSLQGRHAFAVADQPTTPQYAPDPRFAFTTGPSLLGVAHNASVGDWDWRMGTGAPTGAIHLVNAHAPSSAAAKENCKIVEYKSLGPRVRCFDTDAQPRDVPYQVLQASRGRAGRRFGFAWADQPSSTAPYAPYAGYVHNSAGGAVQVQRLATGSYRVFFQWLHSALPDRHETVQLTSFGAGYSTCNTRGWQPANVPGLGDGLAVYVSCANQNGQPMDSRFNVMVAE